MGLISTESHIHTRLRAPELQETFLWKCVLSKRWPEAFTSPLWAHARRWHRAGRPVPSILRIPSPHKFQQQPPPLASCIPPAPSPVSGRLGRRWNMWWADPIAPGQPRQSARCPHVCARIDNATVATALWTSIFPKASTHFWKANKYISTHPWHFLTKQDFCMTHKELILYSLYFMLSGITWQKLNQFASIHQITKFIELQFGQLPRISEKFATGYVNLFHFMFCKHCVIPWKA